VYGNGQTEFTLLIALAAQRKEPKTLAGCETKNWSRNRHQRRCLVIIPPECAPHRPDSGNADGNTKSGIGCIFADVPREMRQPDARIQRYPVGCFVLIFDKDRFLVSPRCDSLLDRGIAPIRRHDAEELVVVLSENL